MNVTSICRDTVSQLTQGVGKVISNVIGFFSSLGSGVTGLFNSNVLFRSVTTGSVSANSEFEFESFNNRVDNLRKNSLGKQYELLNLDKAENIYEEIDGEKIEKKDEHIYEEIDKSRFKTINGCKYEIMDKNEYKVIDEKNFYLIKKPDELENNKLVKVNSMYGNVFDSIKEINNENYYETIYDTIYDTI